MNNEEIYKMVMDELEETLKELKVKNFEAYLRLLGELEKDLRKYLNGTIE
jgi:hypothetical protein